MKHPQHDLLEQVRKLDPFELANKVLTYLVEKNFLEGKFHDSRWNRAIIADAIGLNLADLEREKQAILTQMQQEYDDRRKLLLSETKAIHDLFVSVDESGQSYKVVFLTTTEIWLVCNAVYEKNFSLKLIGAALKKQGWIKQEKRFSENVRKKGHFVPITKIERQLALIKAEYTPNVTDY